MTRARPPFARLLREARERLGWRQEDVLERSGIGRTTLIRWESGETTEPKAREVIAVANVLGIDRVEAFQALGWLTDDDINALRPASELEPDVASMTPEEQSEYAQDLMARSIAMQHQAAAIFRGLGMRGADAGNGSKSA